MCHRVRFYVCEYVFNLRTQSDVRPAKLYTPPPAIASLLAGNSPRWFASPYSETPGEEDQGPRAL